MHHWLKAEPNCAIASGPRLAIAWNNYLALTRTSREPNPLLLVIEIQIFRSPPAINNLVMRV